MQKQENDFIPYKTVKTVAKGKSLILAPHPDDEIFGCGGAILKHLKQGDTVKVVVVTDGAFPVIEQQNTAEYKEIRRKESIEAAKILGYNDVVFLDYEDNNLEFNEDTISHLLEIITEYQPQNIYLPAISETHNDHIALSKIGTEAAKQYEPNINLFYYEIGQIQSANLFLDITQFHQQLNQAIGCFQSQQEALDYKSYINAQYIVRAYNLDKEIKYAEAYYSISSNKIKTGNQLWNQKNEQLKLSKSNESTINKHPLISIIVRTMNRPELAEALESVANQTYPNIEVLVVDALGTNALHLGEKCGIFSLRVITKNKPLARASAANTGLKEVKGEYFCFLDEDDLLFPNHLKDLVELLKSCDSPAAYSNIKRVNEKNELLNVFNNDFNINLLLHDNFIPIHALVYRTKAIQDQYSFDTQFEIYEDWDFLLQVAQLGDFAHLNLTTGIYRDYNSSGANSDQEKKKFFRTQVLDKWRSKISTKQYEEFITSLLKTDFSEKEFIQKNIHINKLENELFIYKNEFTEKKLSQDNSYKKEVRNDQIDREFQFTKKTKEIAQKAIEINSLKNSIIENQYVISKINKQNILKDTQLQILKNDLDKRSNSLSCKITKPIRGLNINLIKQKNLLKKQKQIIEQSGLFDKEFYLKNNPDVAQSGADALEHFTHLGGGEGRNPSEKFDSTYYLENNIDVVKEQMNPLLHYILFGNKEQRKTQSLTNGNIPKEGKIIRPVQFNNNDKISLEVFKKIEFEIQQIRESGFFDLEYYIRKNKEVNFDEINPVEHYYHGGWKGNQNPSEKFDSKYYLENNPDIAKENINPLLHYIQKGEKEVRKIKSVSVPKLSKEKDKHLKKKSQIFDSFMETGEFIYFPNNKPIISIILVLYNQVELTYACIQSILEFADVPFELIIVDNNSTDRSSLLLDRLIGIRTIRNNENLHFLTASNQALNKVEGEYVLFLNNDTELTANSLSSAYNLIKENSKYGAVGGKIILPDGSLQEAGSIIWKDGTCSGYGRGESPSMPEYNFRRIVDYCSAAFLLTRTSLIKSHGGFDTQFKPAYYEETDYCLWLQEQGLQIVYNPRTVIQHFEFASSNMDQAIELQISNRKKFSDKHKIQLQKHLNPNSSLLLQARFAASQSNRKKILYIDDRVPHAELGAGFPRANNILKIISKLDYEISIFPNMFPEEGDCLDEYHDIDPFIEIIRGVGFANFANFIKERADYYDIVWISRPHNMSCIINEINYHKDKFKIIYDAEAIYAERDYLKNNLELSADKKESFNEMIQNELELGKPADFLIAVSDKDAEKFTNQGFKKVKVLGHTLKITESNIEFNDRNGLLFVGNLDVDGSPNVDSILWFVKDIFPIIKKSITDIEMHIIGSNKAKSIQEIDEKGIYIHGQLKDISKYYNKCRVFVAPTRFAAGIPYKVHEAASYSLPVVATRLLVEQLGWKHQKQIIAAEINKTDFAEKIFSLYNDEELWNTIRKNIRDAINSEFSMSNYRDTIIEILDSH